VNGRLYAEVAKGVDVAGVHMRIVEGAVFNNIATDSRASQTSLVFENN
jgi:hypothetical protein